MSRPGQRRRVRNVAQWVRNLFPPPPPQRSPERRWAGEQPRSREWRGDRGRGAGGGGRATSAGREDTAALCPAGEEQPCSSQPREGGWAAEWGGVSGSREWLPRRPGGSPPSASPPRPLVRPGAPPQLVGPPRGAGPSDPATWAGGRPLLSRCFRRPSRACRFCRSGPVPSYPLRQLSRKPD